MRAHGLIPIFCILLACSGTLSQSRDAGSSDSGKETPDAATGEPGEGATPGGGDGKVDAGNGNDAGNETAPDAGLPDAGEPPTQTPVGNPFVYVGGSNGRITSYRVDVSTGALTSTGSVTGLQGPSFLAHHPGSRFLYAVLEGSSQVASFAIKLETGVLTETGARVSSQGSGPAHLSIDRSGKWLLVSNYGDGVIAVYPIQSNGTLGTPTDVRYAGDKAHQILTDPSNRFVLVPCLGSDYIAQYLFDSVQGKLSPNGTPTVATAAGAGPRHLAFHPDRDFAYGINELDDTMTTYGFDSVTGRLSPLQTLGTLENGGKNSDANTTAEVWVHPSGKFVFGSNRATNGTDSLVVYSVDPSSGQLTHLGTTPTGGTTPRSFTVNPEGTRLYVANRSISNANAGNLQLFDVVTTASPGTPVLTQRREVASVTGPDFVGYFVLPASSP